MDGLYLSRVGFLIRIEAIMFVAPAVCRDRKAGNYSSTARSWNEIWGIYLVSELSVSVDTITLYIQCSYDRLSRHIFGDHL